MPTPMIEEAGSEESGVVEVLRSAHEQIKDLFRQFDETTSNRQKKSIGDTCVVAIETYLILNEDVFFPAIRRHLGERRLIVQALAAHQVAKLLIKELMGLGGGEHYNARFSVLKENVTQLLDEEERELLPRVENSDMDQEQVGAHMLEVKARIAPFNGAFSVRGVSAAVAGIAALGLIAWISTRSNRR